MSDLDSHPQQERGNGHFFVPVQPFPSGSVTLLFLLALTPLLVWSAWSWGHRDATLASEVRSFRVNGSSMVPTLLGKFEVAKCDSCELFWYVDPSAKQAQPSEFVCSHCADPLSLVDRKQFAAGDLVADVVRVVEINPQTPELTQGDLVAIEWDKQLHVKRVAATFGDTIDLDGLRLTINGERLEDLLFDKGTRFGLPRFLVDHDAHRKVSRWSPADPNSESKRTSQRCWNLGHRKSDASDRSPWLVYSHRSVYDHDRPSPVWDDYPFNVGLQRKLHGVDRFSLQGDVRCDSARTLEVAFWSTGGNVLASLTVRDDQEFSVSYYDASSAEDLPVSSRSPVAIRVLGGPAVLERLSIHRLIEYRTRPQDDRDQYPISVGRGQCFVLGDNVPVSVDSRDIGLIPTSSIVGRATIHRKAASGLEIR